MRNGIPYTLQNSFGDYLITEKGELNYSEFVNLFYNVDSRMKFLPIIDFWTKFVNKDKKIDEVKLNKIRGLILILSIVKYAELK